MKFRVILLMSALIVVSAQRYFQGRPRGLTWFSPKQHVLSRFQQHYYEPVDVDIPYFRYAKPTKNARPVVIISQEDEELLNQELIDDSNVGPYSDIIDDNRPIFADTQSRSKASLLPEKVDPRFFFGTATTIRNPFIKTATFTLYSTVTISNVVNCIVSGDFVDAAAQAKPCRRKRFINESIEKTDDQFAIAPSEPLNYEPTALPYPIDLMMREKRQIHQQTQSWNPSDSLIVSSKEEDDDSNRSRFFSPDKNSNNKEQRFFLHNSYYVASTTITSYSFVSTTVTKTVDVAIAIGLNCVPTGYVVCV